MKIVKIVHLIAAAFLLQASSVVAINLKSLDDFLEEWRNLPPPQQSQVESLSGFHFAKILEMAIDFWPLQVLTKFFLNLGWFGVEFSDNSQVRLWGISDVFSTTGTFAYDAESEQDGMPCLRVQLSNRFYEGRFRANGDLLNIVVFTDGQFSETNGISDVHLLSKKPLWFLF